MGPIHAGAWVVNPLELVKDVQRDAMALCLVGTIFYNAVTLESVELFMPTPANRQTSANISEGGAPIRRRGLRRQTRAVNLLTRGAGEQEGMPPPPSRAAENTPYRRVPPDVGSSGGLTRLSSGALAALLRPSTPIPLAAPWRQVSATVGGPDSALVLLSEAERQAGEAYLDLFAAGFINPDDDSDVGDSRDDISVRPSYSRGVSAARARVSASATDGSQGEAFDAWSHVRVLEASDTNLSIANSVAHASDDALIPVCGGAPVAAQQMLDREVANHQMHLGGEMVESDIRRAMAEQSYTRLELDCGHAAARQLGGTRALRAYIQASKDEDLRLAAMRVMNCRIDPIDAAGFVRPQLVYRNVTGLCHDVGLRNLAELVWAAIQDAPVNSEKREDLRALLLYNIADCAHDDTFFCKNGTFQRLLAPLDKVYPGVHTMSRTPYEVVQQVSLRWRSAIAAGERADTAEDWLAFEHVCMHEAEAYFERDTALFALIEEQLQRAIAVCRDALKHEI